MWYNWIFQRWQHWSKVVLFNGLGFWLQRPGEVPEVIKENLSRAFSKSSEQYSFSGNQRKPFQYFLKKAVNSILSHQVFKQSLELRGLQRRWFSSKQLHKNWKVMNLKYITSLLLSDFWELSFNLRNWRGFAIECITLLVLENKMLSSSGQETWVWDGTKTWQAVEQKYN